MTKKQTRAAEQRAWTFRSHKGTAVMVTAQDEAEARDRAMTELWGDAAPAIGPSGEVNEKTGQPLYAGTGLSLLEG